MVAYAAPATRPLPDVAIPTTTHNVINLKRYRGKVLVVALVSTTCKQCLDTVQILEKLQRELGPKGFQAVAAAFEPNAQYLVSPMINRYRLSYPVGYLDRIGAFKLAALPDGSRPFVPILIFVDIKGLVRLQLFGDDGMLKNEESAVRLIVNNYLKDLRPAAPPPAKKTEAAPDKESAPSEPAAAKP